MEMQVFKKSEISAKVAEMEKAGFPALRSGLGVPAGKYQFSTPNSESIYATKPIESAKGKFGLTLVAGTLKGFDESNKSVQDVNITFGLTAADKQFVVTLDQLQAIDPNQTYDVVINDKGRIASIVLASKEVLTEA